MSGVVGQASPPAGSSGFQPRVGVRSSRPSRKLRQDASKPAPKAFGGSLPYLPCHTSLHAAKILPLVEPPSGFPISGRIWRLRASINITTNATLGAGRLASIDGPLANDTITCQYDELGRTTNRAINSAAQNVAYDALGRVTALTNAPGSFTNKWHDACCIE